MDYKDKIKKLLALAESPNENEAKAALLKARKLMAEHKILQKDIDSLDNETVQRFLTGITYSNRKNPWIESLSAVIAENYCCRSYSNKVHRKQTRTIGFIGFENDVEVCHDVFKYAVDCVLLKTNEIKKRYTGYDIRYITQQFNSYGAGFIFGIKSAFEKQQKDNKSEWGLALTVPKAVTDILMPPKKNAAKVGNISGFSYFKGYKDGKKFVTEKRIEG